MSTWGPSKKRSAKSRQRTSSTRPAARGTQARGRAAGPGRASADEPTKALEPARRSGTTRNATPPSGGSRREQTTDELRRAVGGREPEFIGIGLIVAGLLIGLAIYVNLAGPLGR